MVDVGDELGRVVDMLHCHVSQFYEWLPYNGGYAGEVPADDAARRSWLEERFRRRLRPLADRFRDLLERTYGELPGRRAEYVEAFEASEYGAPLDAAARARLFPFLPARRKPPRSAWGRSGPTCGRTTERLAKETPGCSHVDLC